MATTFWSLSVTSTGFSPPSTHFFAHWACAAFAPFTPHFESLIHPSQLLSFGAAMAMMLHRNNPRTTNTIFFMVHLPSALRRRLLLIELFEIPRSRNEAASQQNTHTSSLGRHRVYCSRELNANG